ncbi:8-oxo-dGTP diphosphatase [Candidatus Saccharibacteria bacterium]|nr:8-oxo-dGTP diphosphatase [Candidatus Saccharibacteria bacterium]
MKRLQTVLVFLIRDEHILLARKKRGHGLGKLNGAGGKLEPGETPTAAAEREVHEELGVYVDELQEVAMLHFTQEPKIDAYSDEDCTVYLCRSWASEPTESDELEPFWFPLGSIPYDRMWVDDQYWLPLVLAGKHLEASFMFDGSLTLVDHTITELNV